MLIAHKARCDDVICAAIKDEEVKNKNEEREKKRIF